MPRSMASATIACGFVSAAVERCSSPKRREAVHLRMMSKARGHRVKQQYVALTTDKGAPRRQDVKEVKGFRCS